MNRTPLQESAVRMHERLRQVHEEMSVQLAISMNPGVRSSLKHARTLLERVIAEVSSHRLEADK